jgi:hypothetical protein
MVAWSLSNRLDTSWTEIGVEAGAVILPTRVSRAAIRISNEADEGGIMVDVDVSEVEVIMKKIFMLFKNKRERISSGKEVCKQRQFIGRYFDTKSTYILLLVSQRTTY